jgi:hypothetical protein
MKDEIQKVNLGTNEALRVTADGEFIWHPEADAMIEEGDFTSSPAMRHILRALRKALAAPVQEPVAWMFQHEETGRTMCVDAQQVEWGFEKGNPRLKKIAPLYTTPPAAQQSDVDAMIALARADEREQIAQMIEDAPPLMPFAQNDQGGCMMCGFTPKLAAKTIRARGETK